MAAIIIQAIPPQGFELVRDQIGAIVAIELANQAVLQPLRLPESVEVMIERLMPADSSSLIQINVHVSGAIYGNMTQKDAQGFTIYDIDIDATGSGSTDSAQRLHKYLGIVMYIFRTAQYRLLGFSPGFIGGTYVQQFESLDPNRKEDSAFSCFARIKLGVRIQETTIPWEGVPLFGNDTSIKLDYTDKGYKFVFNS